MMSMMPDLLYHYTSQEAFVAIVGSRKMWATDILFLNDAAEFTYAVSLALKILNSYSAPEQARIKSALEELKDGPSWGTYDSTYLISFSENGDLLSQWRAYCPAAGGVSISFHADELQSLAAVSRLIKCEYETSQQEGRLRLILDTALKEPDDGKARAKCANDVIRLAPELKHPSFREEQEWRLLIDSVHLKDPAVRYRPGRSMFMPYLEVNIELPGGRLPLDHLVLGPTPNADLAWLSGWRYLKSLHLRGVIQTRGFFRPSFGTQTFRIGHGSAEFILALAPALGGICRCCGITNIPSSRTSRSRPAPPTSPRHPAGAAQRQRVRMLERHPAT